MDDRYIEALRDHDARLRSVIDTAVDGIFTINDKGIIGLANLAAEKLFGYSAEELIGRNITILMQEPDRGRHDSNIQDYIRTGNAKIIGIGREVLAVHKNGTLFPVDLAVSEFQVGGNRYFTGIVRDITARKRAERRAAVEHGVTRVLAGASTFHDVAGKVLQVVGEILGWSIGEFLIVDPEHNHLSCAEFWTSPSTSANEFESITRSITFAPGAGLPGRVWSLNWAVWVPDFSSEADFPRASVAAREGIHSALGFPIRIGEEVLGVMDFFGPGIQQPDEELLGMLGIIGSQIGQFMERKRVEDQLQKRSQQIRLFEEKLRDTEKLAILGTLASQLAHEIGTPLNVMSGRLELLAERTKSDESVSKDITVIQKQIDRITKIIRDLLDLTHKREGEHRNTGLHRLLRGMFDFLQFQIEKAGIKLQVLFAPHEFSIYGDVDQLQQLFMNIMINAIQAMAEGGTLTVRTRRSTSEEEPLLEVEVRDTGAGILPEHLERIFDPFFSTKTDRGGTGLGLSIVQDIVKKHGGQISVESKVGSGTTFTILLRESPPVD